MSDETHEPELTAMEAGLRSLTPRAPAIDRDRLLFLAGRTSARRRVAAWRIGAIGSTLAAVGLALALYSRPAPERVEVEVVRWLPAPGEQRSPAVELAGPTDSSPTLAWPYLDHHEPYGQMQLRRLAFNHGVDALPQSSAADLESQYPATTNEPPSAGSRIWWQLAHP